MSPGDMQLPHLCWAQGTLKKGLSGTRQLLPYLTTASLDVFGKESSAGDHLEEIVFPLPQTVLCFLLLERFDGFFGIIIILVMCLAGNRKGVIFFYIYIYDFFILRFCPNIFPFLSLILSLFIFP